MLVAIPELPESSNSQQASQNPGDEAQQPQGQAAQPAGAASPEDSMSTRKPPLWGRSGGNSRTVTDESSSPFRSVEINSGGAAPSPYARHPRQGEMAGGSPLGSPGSPRRADAHVVANGLQQIEPALREQQHAFQQEILQSRMLQLRQEQLLQHQLLREHYEAHRQKLVEQHEHQLRQHLKELWEQKRAEEERARREQERLELLRKKDKHEQSAVASSEVKQKLQGFLLSKKAAQEAKAAAANGVAPSPGSVSSGAGSQSSSTGGFRNWSVLQPPPQSNDGSGPSSSTAGTSPSSAPYPRPQMQLGKYDDDFPLRKTASEPNLKVRLKQRVIERRNSPLVRRKQERLCSMRRRSQLAMDSACSSNPDSGPNSPPSSAAGGPSQSQVPRGSTPIQEEGGAAYAGALAGSGNQGSMSDLSQLYTSPSMPNISLGRPPAPSSSSQEGMKLPPVSEAEVRAAFAARFGMPLTGQMLPGTLPFYPSLPVIEGEYSNPSSPSYIQKQMQSLEQAAHHPHGMLPAMYHAAAAPITDAQVAHARLNKQGARPLGRTQSAPLPLGHPMLAGTMSLSHYQEIPESWQELLAEQQQQQQLALHEQQQQQHNRLKQQIRQTVLTRAGGRVAAQHQQQSQQPPLEQTLEVDDGAEVIDLTERGGREGSSEMARQQRDREQFLQQQRDLMMRHTLQISEGSAFTPRAAHVARPLSRALSSPLVALSQQQAPPEQLQGKAGSLATALAFDSLMLKHACICGDNSGHPEHGGRLQSIWARLQETGLALRCCRLRARKATLEELQSCHSEAHTLLFGTNPLNRQKLDVSKLAQLPIKSFVRLPCGGVGVDSDTTWNELHTSSAARMAAGCVIDLATKAACGEIRNGFAVVRPPGHHAEPSQAMGFCFFNSVAVAARQLQQRFDLDKILIIDWDVHHGNGTQQMFYDDQRVLYLSIHRHDEGNFFPGTGGPTECGAEDGVGFNVNLAWSGGLSPPMGDAEYLAAFRTVVMPIARDFDPDLVLVSAGFDAAAGHPAPLGGYQVSAACFGYMTHQLMQLAGGKVVLSLEGGYDLPAICDAAQECVRALLGDEPSPLLAEELRRPPCQNAVDTLQKTIAIQTPHWPCVKRLAHTVTWSALEAGQKERDESEAVTAMASLSMQQRGGSGSSLHLPAERCPSLEEPMDQDEVK